jgi:hypothetical protein
MVVNLRHANSPFNNNHSGVSDSPPEGFTTGFHTIPVHSPPPSATLSYSSFKEEDESDTNVSASEKTVGDPGASSRVTKDTAQGVDGTGGNHPDISSSASTDAPPNKRPRLHNHGRTSGGGDVHAHGSSLDPHRAR